jgi:hypothetical protein
LVAAVASMNDGDSGGFIDFQAEPPARGTRLCGPLANDHNHILDYGYPGPS